MNRQRILLIATTFISLLILLTATVLFSRYADQYSGKFYVDKTALVRSQTLSATSKLVFLRDGATMAILHNGSETLAVARLKIFGASGIYVLRLNSDLVVEKARALHTEHGSPLFALYHRRLMSLGETTVDSDGLTQALWENHYKDLRRNLSALKGGE